MEACWAHNPEVRGSKPRSANVFFRFGGILARTPACEDLLTLRFFSVVGIELQDIKNVMQFFENGFKYFIESSIFCFCYLF